MPGRSDGASALGVSASMLLRSWSRRDVSWRLPASRRRHGRAADGDPASDFLITNQVFLTSQSASVSPAQRQLLAVVRAANRARVCDPGRGHLQRVRHGLDHRAVAQAGHLRPVPGARARIGLQGEAARGDAQRVWLQLARPFAGRGRRAAGDGVAGGGRTGLRRGADARSAGLPPRPASRSAGATPRPAVDRAPSGAVDVARAARRRHGRARCWSPMLVLVPRARRRRGARARTRPAANRRGVPVRLRWVIPGARAAVCARGGGADPRRFAAQRRLERVAGARSSRRRRSAGPQAAGRRLISCCATRKAGRCRSRPTAGGR